MQQFADYDFLDFGCSKGGSIEFAKETFGGRGLGLDIDPAKVEQSKAAGFEAIVQDCSQLDPKTMGQVRYVIMSHFLEHVPSIDDVRKIIGSACRVSREFVLIQQPWFDADPYLFDLGLKAYWSSWKCHLNHMTRLEMLNVLRDVAPKTGAKRFLIGARHPILSSDAPEIHPLLSPIQHAGWSLEAHGEKPTIQFDQLVFRDLFAVILMEGDEPNPELARYMQKRGGVIFFDSARSPMIAPTSNHVAQPLRQWWQRLTQVRH
jgi:SAM-dependent methyltransferase